MCARRWTIKSVSFFLQHIDVVYTKAVTFVVGSLDDERPHIFLIDFDKVEVLCEADRQLRLTEMKERGYSCPTILPNTETVEAVEHGVQLGKEIAAVPTMADISFLPPCDDD